MIAEHGATVLQFTAVPRASRARTPLACADDSKLEGPLPDNVIVLARFSRRAHRTHRRYWLGGPPEGEAA